MKKIFKLLFGKRLIVIFLAVFLFVLSQPLSFSRLFQRGPSNVYAEGDLTNCGQPGFDACPEPGFEGGDLPIPGGGAPVTPPSGGGPSGGGAPSCDSNWNVSCCSGSDSLSCPNQSTFQSLGYEYWANEACSNKGGRTCSAPPPPPATPPSGGASSGGGGQACTPDGQISTKRDCVGTQMCTFNQWRGTDCSLGWGGAYDCQNDTACGYSNSTPPGSSSSQACTPNSFDTNQCRTCSSDGTFWGTPGSDFGPNGGSAAWCSCAQKYNQSAYNQSCQVSNPPPANPAPPAGGAQVCTPNSFDTNQCRTCSSDGTFWGTPGSDFGPNGGSAQWCSCAQKYNPSAYAQSCQSTTPPPPPAPANSCPAGSQFICGQLAYDTCIDNLGQRNGNVCKTGASAYRCYASSNPQCNSSGTADNDFNLSCNGCGNAVPPTTCTATTTQAIACVGQASCIFYNNRASDCSTTRTGPFNCQNIAGQCGFTVGSSCTPSTTQQNVCVGQQMCIVSVATNANCTISRGTPTNCQNSAQCGFIQQSGQGGVIVTNNNTNTNTNTNTITIPAVRDIVTGGGNIGIGTSGSYYYAGVQQLPKTGLPALAWIAGAFLPAGMGFKKFGKVKKQMENHPSYIWEKRQFKA